MDKKIIGLLLLLILLTGCNPKQTWEDIKNLQWVKPPEPKIEDPTNTTNQTNTTSETIEEQPPIEYDESNPNIFILSGNSILIIDDKKQYIIDAPKQEPKIISLLKRIDIQESEFVIVTIDKEEHIGGIPYVVVVAPPKEIYDNGIENEYRESYMYRLDKFNTYWNRTSTKYITLIDDFKKGDFDFFVPYSRGLSETKEENSIIVNYMGQLLYMSDCYGSCEDKIPPITTTFFVLANNGNCPTNSFDFVLGTGAEYVIGDEICQELKEELDFMGIKQISINEKGALQILLKGGEHEIRYGQI